MRSWLLVLAGVTALLVPVQLGGTASAQGGVPGTLDPTFDADGIAINELVSNLSRVDDAARLPDGRVLVLADGRVWRFFADGTLDTTFDLDGVLLPDPSGTLRPTKLALRPGGGFVLASGGGGFDPTCPAGRVAEFDADGKIVTTFGVNGVACVDFPNYSGAADLAVQADGRILVLGNNQVPTQAAHVALARLSTAGATVDRIIQPLHSSFEIGDEMAIQADGNIVVAGNTNTFPNFLSIGVVLSRYLGGTLALDTSFGGGDGFNVESVFLDRSRQPLRLALQPDGQGMSVIAGGDNPTNSAAGAPRVAAIEQLLFDEDGILSDSPVDMELTGHSSVTVDDLTATATGYVANGHFEDFTPTPPTVRDGLVVAALGQEFIEPVPLLVSPPNVNLPLAGGSSLLLPDGKVLLASVLQGPAGGQMLFNRLIEDTAADPRTVSLDPAIGTSFGLPGFRTLNALTNDTGQAVAVQPDSKVVVGGLTTTASAGPAGPIGGRGFVLRHNDDGALDATFGGPRRPGVAFVDFKVNGVALAPDGRVVAVGSRFFPVNGTGPHEPGAVQRLLANGSPDPTWNDGRPALVAPPGINIPGTFFRDVVVQPDGKVVVVGDYHLCVTQGCADNANSIVVARFLAGGTLDDAFGSGGFVLIGPVTGASVDLAQGRGVARLPDGRIVVTGSLGSRLVVARLEADGDPDPTFAAPAGPFGPGVLADDLIAVNNTDQGLGRDIALRPDGRIVVSGDLVLSECGSFDACFTTRVAIAVQYLPNGIRDGSFGTGGLTRITDNASEGHGVAVDAAGNVVVGGSAYVFGMGSDVLLARLSPTGVLDPAFGTNGLVLTNVDQTEAGNALAIAPDGKIVIAGVNSDTRGNRVLTARFEPGGALQCGPSPLDFGAVVLGTGAANRTVTCTNTGPSRLTITAITRSGANAADFVPSTGPCLVTLVPRQSCQIPVAFTPSAVGARAAALSVAHTGQGAANPTSVALSGTGIARNTTLSFAPTPLTFPEQLGLTRSPARTVTVTNIGTVPVTINGVSIENGPAGDFAISASTCTGVTLPPGGRCQVSVTFTPRAPGARAATLRFDDTGVGTPHRLSLRGTGATPTVIVNPGVGRPGTVTATTGTKFPPNRAITLVWVEPGSLLPGGFPEPAFSVTSNADGTLTASVIAFPKSRIGGRTLLATIGAFTANTPFLVTPGTVQGPDFVYRR